MTINNSSLGDVTKISNRKFRVTAFDNINNNGKYIVVTITAEDYVGQYSFRVNSIPITGLDIYNKETQQPLGQNLTVTLTCILIKNKELIIK